MAEAIDFKDWAQQVQAAIALQGDPDLADIGERIARTGIEELLKRIWNARGAADQQAIDEKLSLSAGQVTSEPYRQELKAAIQQLDR
jgi:hypothetical protein